jgi:hypothetical protein
MQGEDGLGGEAAEGFAVGGEELLTQAGGELGELEERVFGGEIGWEGTVPAGAFEEFGDGSGFAGMGMSGEGFELAVEGGHIAGDGVLMGGEPEGREEAFDDGGTGEGSAIGAASGPGQDQGLAGSGGGDVGVILFAGGVGEGAPTEVETGIGEVFAFTAVEEGGGGRGCGEDAFVEAEDEGEGDLGLAGAIDGADHDLVEGWGDDAEGEAGQTGFGDGHPIPGGEGGVGEGAFEILHPTEHFLPGGMMDGAVEGGEVMGFSLPTGQGSGHVEISPEGVQGQGERGTIDGGAGEGEESAKGFDGRGEETEGIGGQAVGRQGWVEVQPGVATDAVLEGEIFEVIDQGWGIDHQAGFEGAEPIFGGPAAGGDAEGAAGEFGDGMMAHGFAQVGEEGDVMTAEGLGEEVAIILQAPDRDADITEATAALVDMVEDETGGETGFGGGIEAFDEVQMGREDGGGVRRGRRGEGVVPSGGEVAQVGSRHVSGGGTSVVGGQGANEGGEIQGAHAMEATEEGGPGNAPEGGVGMGGWGVGWSGSGGSGGSVGVRGIGLEAEGEGGVVGAGEDGGEQVHLGQGHFGEAIEPEAGEGGDGGSGLAGGHHLGSGEHEQVIGIMEVLTLQPVLVTGEKEGQVVDFIGQGGGVGGGGQGKILEVTGTGTDAVEFAEHLTQLGGEADGAGGGSEGAQVGFVAEEEGAEHHDAALLRQDIARGVTEGFEGSSGEAVEGEDFETGEAGDTGGQEATFDLEGGLFGSDPEERWALGMSEEEVADLLDAGVSLAGAGRAEEELDGGGGGHGQVDRDYGMGGWGMGRNTSPLDALVRHP